MGNDYIYFYPNQIEGKQIMKKKMVLLNNKNIFYTLKDEEENIALLEEIITNHGYQIKQMNDIHEFIKELKKFKKRKRYKTEDINNGVHLLTQNIHPNHKFFFEHFILTVKWAINILNSLQIAFALIHQNKYLAVNNILKEITGMNSEEISKLEAGDLIHISKRRTFKKNLEKCSKKQGKEFFDHATFTSKDNKIRNIFILTQNHQIGKISYIAIYGFCDEYHNTDDIETITYLKFLSYEINTIISNLITVSQLNQNTETKENPSRERCKSYSRSKKYFGLTSREHEVLCSIHKGLTSHEIAKELSISKRTVETHRTNILEKTGARNSIELVKLADKYNLITD